MDACCLQGETHRETEITIYSSFVNSVFKIDDSVSRTQAILNLHASCQLFLNDFNHLGARTPACKQKPKGLQAFKHTPNYLKSLN